MLANQKNNIHGQRNTRIAVHYIRITTIIILVRSLKLDDNRVYTTYKTTGAPSSSDPASSEQFYLPRSSNHSFVISHDIFVVVNDLFVSR